MSEQSYRIHGFRYEDDGRWKEGVRAVPEDMKKEDLVTRFLFWLEEKVIGWRVAALRQTPVVRGLRSELDKKYAEIAEQRERLRRLYPEDYEEAERERDERFSYLRLVDELR